jgi:hypothetical protein
MSGARVPLRIAAMVALPCLVVGVVAGAALSRSYGATHPTSRATVAGPADAGANDHAPGNTEGAEERPLSGKDRKTYDRVRATVDDGIARGVWTEENRAQVRADLRTLPPERARELVRPVLVALDQRQLRFEGNGPPF